MTSDSDINKLGDERIIIRIDRDLEDLIPGYIENRQKDMKSILASLENEDYETIRILGHSMKGSGGGYGFDKITEIGKSIEQAAIDINSREIKNQIEELSCFIKGIEIIYE
jgi:HPt (histidine-containing phosphotransfer) domain-containing protein